MLHRHLTVLGWLTLVGCQSYRPVTTAPEPDGAVRVVYATPTDVQAVAPGGGARRLGGIKQLGGRVANVRGDTVVLTLTRTNPGYLLARAPAAPTVTVVRGPGTRLEALRLDPVRTTGAVLGASVAVLVIVIVIYAVGMEAAYGS